MTGEVVQRFRDKFTLDKRLEESARVIGKHPDRLPIIIESNDQELLDRINRTKYLIPNTMTVGGFITVLRRRIDLEPSEAIFVLVDGSILPPTAATMSELYNQYQDRDHFLYLLVTKESTFG